DRVSDVLIFTGVAHSGLNSPVSGYWAAILALLTAYVGMMGQAVGGKREFGGVMAKPWRMVALHVGAWLTLASILWNDGGFRMGGLAVLDWTCIVVIVGCIQTISVRLTHTMRALARKKPSA